VEFRTVLDALQTDELCLCNWNKRGETLNAAALMAV
jgi:alkyl hydroperoxide reductase subunit AhpC